jgi:hypothetical protein
MASKTSGVKTAQPTPKKDPAYWIFKSFNVTRHNRLRWRSNNLIDWLIEKD